MTTEDTIAADIRAVCTDEELADAIHLLDMEIAYSQKQRGQIEMTLTRRLQERNALELAHPTLLVKLAYPSPEYNTPKLRSLLGEVVSPEEFIKAYKSEHTEQVEVAARFDGRQLNVLTRKYGQPVQEVLDQARLPATPRLRITAKDVVNHGDNSQLAAS